MQIIEVISVLYKSLMLHWLPFEFMITADFQSGLIFHFKFRDFVNFVKLCKVVMTLEICCTWGFNSLFQWCARLHFEFLVTN